MSKIHPILLICLVLLLPGCATLSSQGDDAASVQEVSAEPETLNLPNVDLDGEILFRLLTADVAVQRQQFGLAASLYLFVAQDTRDPRLAEEAARMALFARMDPEALEAARLWVELVPDSRSAREAIIAAYIRNGDAEAVQEHLDYMLAHGDHDGKQKDDRLFQLIVSLVQHDGNRDIQTAYMAVKRLAERHPDDPFATYAYGYIALHDGKLSEARAAIEATMKARPDWLGAKNLYAGILRMQGSPFEAAVYLGGVVKDNPDAIDIRLNYARLLVETRQLDEALKQYLWVIDKRPDNEDALLVAGLLSVQLNQLDQAKDLLERLVAMGQRLDVAHFYLGQIADIHDDTEAAINHYTEVTGGEHYVDAQLRIAALLAQRGDVLLARAHLDKLREAKSPELNRIDILEAHILANDGQDEEAMKVYQTALQREPDDRDLLYNQALLADKLGQFELVEKNLQKVIAENPDDASALNALGFSMSNHTTRYKEAYRYVQRALELRPDSGPILDSVGWVLYRLGRLDEAVDYLRRSLEFIQEKEVYAHLGEVLWMRGDRDAAREIWQQALERVPGDKVILDVMKRFGQ
jgi:tetratricopeptide (TPR) repeat protein